jgi:hypothetical protein
VLVDVPVANTYPEIREPRGRRNQPLPLLPGLLAFLRSRSYAACTSGLRSDLLTSKLSAYAASCSGVIAIIIIFSHHKPSTP